MQNKIKLILDANAFILQQDIQSLAQKYDLYTNTDILSEIKDIHSRSKLDNYVNCLKFMDPSPTSIKKVKSFAMKTGDIANLSEVDIILIAMAYTFIEQQNQTNLLRKEPIELTQEIKYNYDDQIESVDEEEKEEYDEDGFKIIKSKQQIKKEKIQKKIDLQLKKEMEIQQKIQQDIENQQKNQQENQQENFNENKQENQSDYESDSDDGKGWINEQNFTKVLNNAITQEQDNNIFNVSVMTSDFSIQNVLIQMGIQLLATDGMVIKKAKRFVLECYACFRICKNANLKFCPTCGNNCLLKLSCSLNADGTFKFYRKKGHKIRTTGNIYSIPKPIMGRNNNDLILREDEFLMHGREIKLRNIEKQKEVQYQMSQIEFENGMGFQKKKGKNDENFQIGYGRKNVNDRFAFKR